MMDNLNVVTKLEELIQKNEFLIQQRKNLTMQLECVKNQILHTMGSLAALQMVVAQEYTAKSEITQGEKK